MMLWSARSPRAVFCCTAFAAAALLFQAPAFAQSGSGSSNPPPHPSSSGQASPGQASPGQVIYSRSTDETGQTTTTVGPAAHQPGNQNTAAPIATGVPTDRSSSAGVATDAEREALTFTSFDMDVHLVPAAQRIAVRALVTVRNDGRTPLVHIPLQISSSLTWERIRVGAHDAAFQVATLNSDADHTGQLHEAAVTLAAPLAPRATLTLDVTYSGAISPNAQRLLAIGTPADIAIRSDWDSIGMDFTGLRGFGNVVWYPVSSVPVILGDGARLFDEMGEHKLRLAGTHFRLRLTDEFPTGQAPTVALVNGHPIALAITPGGATFPGIATAVLDHSVLGFEAPSLFVAVRAPKPATNATLWALPADEPAVAAWSEATANVTPFLQGWLGDRPRSQLTVLDLPDPEDAPFESGALLAASIRPAPADQLDGILVHALTQAWLGSPRAWPPAWIEEGAAHFMSALWIERTEGRDKALESLEDGRQALALAEPASPGTSPGQPLARAISPIYYRTKAAYVFWMLRDLAGDDALAAALRAYDPAADAPAADASGPASRAVGSSPTGSNSGPGEFERLIEKANPRRNLSWFFADWVDADKGLPDIAIQKVFPEPAEAGNTLVGVTLANSGYAAAEIPVTVSTAATSIAQRVLVPARGGVVERFLVVGKPTRVQANDGGVPEVEASVHVMNLAPQADSGSSSSQTGVPR